MNIPQNKDGSGPASAHSEPEHNTHESPETEVRVPSTEGENVPPFPYGEAGSRTSSCGLRNSIGEGIPADDRKGAVLGYLAQGFTVIPLRGPEEGHSHGRGKAPKVNGYQSWTPEHLDADTIERFWGEGRDSNLAILLRDDHVVIDLDSKADEGRSARAWVDAQEDLRDVPREDTKDGCHLHLRCSDIPPFLSASGSPFLGKLVGELAPGVHAELFHSAARLAITVSPSVHPSGHRYRWEVVGAMPSFSWVEVQAIFNFKVPGSTATQDNASIATDLLRRFRGNIGTLDIIALAREAGLYGRMIDADSGRHTVKCPFRAEHSDSANPWTPTDTSTVIYEGREGNWPSFHCLHAHCNGRGVMEFLVAVDDANPGIVDRHCREMYEWDSGQRSADGRPRIVLPGNGRPQGDFAREVAEALRTSGGIYCRNDEVVEIREATDQDETGGLKLQVIGPAAAVTRFEREIEFGQIQHDKQGRRIFEPASMSKPEILLASAELRELLPRITRVLQVSVPLIRDDRMIFPNPGYDPGLMTYLATTAPRPTPLASLNEAFDVINDVYGNQDGRGFCWKNDQAFVHAVARLITPMCRGLMGWEKAPLFILKANRSRLGKDTAAQITIVIYTGQEATYPPLAKNSDDEMRKRITSALRSGQPFFHIANLRGYIDSPSLEAATDGSRRYIDRLLGGSNQVTLVNEMEYSLSANAGTTWTPDIEGRSRVIELFFAGEDVNNRAFRHPDIISYVRINRERILSAILTLIVHWDRAGRPEGPTPFASFPAWSRIVGGILSAAGIGDPCLPQESSGGTTGDTDTEDMRRLFQLAADAFPEHHATKREIYDLIERQEEPLFGYLNLNDKAGQTKLGCKLRNFDGRELSGIVMRVDASDRSRLRYIFSRDMRTLQTLQTFALGSGNVGCPVLSSFSCSPHPVSACGPEIPTSENTAEVRNVCNVRNPGWPTGRATDLFHPPVASAVVHITRESGVDRFLASIGNHPGLVSLGVRLADGRPGALHRLQPSSVRLVTVAFGSEVFVLDALEVANMMVDVVAALSTKVVIAHDARSILLPLRQFFGLRPRAAVCTMTFDLLLSAGRDGLRHDLGTVIQRYLGPGFTVDQATADWTAPVLSAEHVRFAVDEVRHLYPLALAQLEEGRRDGLDLVMKLETDLNPVLLEMGANGFPVDRTRLEGLVRDVEPLVRQSESETRTLLGDPALNLNSPDQLLAAFARNEVDLEDTKEETLARIDRPAALALLRYRQGKKLLEQAEGCLHRVGDDGRIHCEWDATSARTGRISSRNPNLQGVARGPLREVFRPRDGRKLVIADYSQIELRVAAVHTGDETMLGIFCQEEDIHIRTAAEILGKPLDQVTTEERRKAKAVNFGFLFGQSIDGFVRYAGREYGVGMSVEEARTFRGGWLQLFPRIAEWQERCRRDAGSEMSEVRTVLGRRRHLPSGADKWWERYSIMLNTPIQGTASDGLKRSMLRIARELDADSSLVASIHDEIIVECPEESADSVRELVQAIMVEEMEEVLEGEVPVRVECSIRDSWAM